MNGETLNRATPIPFTTPTDVPAATPAMMPIRIASPTASGMAAKAAAIAVAPTTDVSARMVPTERSKPPVSSANICPIDTSAR